jgi:hypothetical protein
MPLTSLIYDLLDDLNRPGMPWQVGAIVASILFGWLSAQVVRIWWNRRRGEAGSL